MAGTLRLSPLLMERYLAAAKAITRLAIGDAGTFETTTYLVGTQTERRARTGEAPLGAGRRHRGPPQFSPPTASTN